MKRLQPVGIGIAAVGSLAAVVNFFRLYTIPGRCLPGSASCDGLLASWKLQERVALASVVVGLVVFIYGALTERRRK